MSADAFVEVDEIETPLDIARRIVSKAVEIGEIVCQYHPWRFAGIKYVGWDNVTIYVERSVGAHGCYEREDDLLTFPIAYLTMDTDLIHATERQLKENREIAERQETQRKADLAAQNNRAADLYQLERLKAKYEIAP